MLHYHSETNGQFIEANGEGFDGRARKLRRGAISVQT
jgi:hypothetical protein